MKTWTLDPAYADTPTGAAFNQLEAVFALTGEPITSAPLSHVIRVEIDGTRYYVKRYTGAGKNPLRRWFTRPRIQGEWENLQRFARWGLPTAKIVAYGWERRAGAFVRGAMITEEVPNTHDLATLAQNGAPCLSDAAWIDTVSRQIAHIARTLHDHRFAHNDLKWRNILVQEGDVAKVFLIDCPAGRFWVEPFLSYRIVKDLASLDSIAKYQLTRTQRMRFYHYYSGRSRLNSTDRKRIRQVVRYREGSE